MKNDHKPARTARPVRACAARLLRRALVLLVLLFVFVALASRVEDRLLREHLASNLPASQRASPTAYSPNTDDTSLYISILTLNVWDLPLWFPFSNKTARLHRIPTEIIRTGADVIFLQEAFEPTFRAFLATSLSSYAIAPLPMAYCHLTPWLTRTCGGGLVTLSHFPIVDNQFARHPVHRFAKFDERFGGKGFSFARVSTPLGDIGLINMHLYAGRTQADESQRLRQLEEFGAWAAAQGLFKLPLVLGGDLNILRPASCSSGEESRGVAYRYLVGTLLFQDTVRTMTRDDLTYDPLTNRYAALPMYRGEGQQKLDYVFLRLPAAWSADVQAADVVFREQAPLSDHYGFLTTVRLSRALEAAKK